MMLYSALHGFILPLQVYLQQQHCIGKSDKTKFYGFLGFCRAFAAHIRFQEKSPGPRGEIRPEKDSQQIYNVTIMRRCAVVLFSWPQKVE